MNGDGLIWMVFAPAFVAGLMVLATHVPLGEQVLKRGIVFIDLAIAQIAAFGLILANTLHLPVEGIGGQLVAVAAALGGAMVLSFTERRWPQVQEAIIGVSFVLAASAMLLLLSHNAHGGEHLKHLLEGQILWVGSSQLVTVAVIYTAVLIAWYALGLRQHRMGFYLLFAITVTQSVQLVGVYLVFASLIIPPLAVNAWPARWRRPMAYSFAAIAYALGLGLSAAADVPAGAMIVLCLAVLGIVVAVISRRLPQDIVH